MKHTRSPRKAAASTPTRTAPWPNGPSHFSDEVKAVAKLLNGPALPLARSDSVMAFRKAVCRLYKAKHAVTVSSGTAAIHAALAAAGVGSGDEVITTNLTDYGSVAGILQLNAIPVFCDVELGTKLMDPVDMERRITRHTKAIMPIHTNGYVADMPKIMKIARRHKIPVIEDAAQCHFAEIAGRFAGTWGDYGCFSTNESKHIRSGEGGFIFAQREADASYADLFADKCYRRIPSQPKTPAFPAVNLRMSAIHAAIALCQLKRLPGFVKARRAAGIAFEKALAGFPFKAHPDKKGAKYSYWNFEFFPDATQTHISAAEFVKRLQAEGIPCYVGSTTRHLPDWDLFKTLDKNPSAFRSYCPGRLARGMFSEKLPNVEWALKNIITLPISPYVGAAEARDFRRALGKIIGCM